MVKKYKKLIKVCLIILVIYIIDFTLVAKALNPIFVIPGPSVKDGGTREFYGLGYKVIGWKQLSVQNDDGKEIIGYLKGYEISIFPNYQDINEGPQKELEFVLRK